MRLLLKCSILALVMVVVCTGKVLADDAMMVGDGKHVKLHYTLKVEGQTMDSSAEREPFEFDYGESGLISGFSENIKGMKSGEKKTFSVEPKEAYGFHNPEAVMGIEKKDLPVEDVQTGMVFRMPGKDGSPLQAIVIAVEGNKAILDFNHPLAGKTLEFDVEILGVA